ncbi:MAG TPA: M23 family metallopeptidase [Spirochaetota bacterium]
MTRIFAIISGVAAVLALSFTLIAQEAPETFSVDDDNMQEYAGKIGKWVFIPNKQKLQGYIHDFSTDEKSVAETNPGLIKYLNTYVFIPFGKEYLQKLSDKGTYRTTLSATTDQFIWPVGDVVRVSSVLGFRGREFHTGLDIPAPKGSPVRAAMEGQVIFEGYQGGYGNMLDIQHRNGFITRYGHNTAVLVKKGDFVKKGQIIALAGSTGRSTGNHVHFEILCNSIPLDPLDFLPDSSKVQIAHPLKNWKHN